LERLLEKFKPHTYVELNLFGIDLSITKAVVMLWVAAVIVFAVVWLAGRRSKLVPSGWQNLMESVLEFVRDNMVLEVMGKEGLIYFPWIATLFLYILVANLIGLIPGSFTVTSLTGTTAAWAVVVFILYHVAGVKKLGVKNYIKSFAPSGVPIPILFLMVPIEIVSHFFRPFSLAVRLFANMTAGHMIILVFTFMAMTSVWWVKPLPFGGVLVMKLFEIFVSFIQAYIFAILASIYISLAVHEH
jgi:F-type H+-transporting ATPase subunit a